VLFFFKAKHFNFSLYLPDEAKQLDEGS